MGLSHEGVENGEWDEFLCPKWNWKIVRKISSSIILFSRPYWLLIWCRFSDADNVCIWIITKIPIIIISMAVFADYDSSFYCSTIICIRWRLFNYKHYSICHSFCELRHRTYALLITSITILKFQISSLIIHFSTKYKSSNNSISPAFI